MAKGKTVAQADVVEPGLPRLEQAILVVFRDYLMTPGKMLCLSSLDRKIYGAALAKLVEKRLLTVEQYKDGFSLTEDGYAAMRRCPQSTS